MIEGLVLGLLSFVSMVFTWRNLPLWVKVWCARHPLMAEGLSTLSAFMFLTGVSTSLVAVFGSVVYGVLANISMSIYQWAYGEPNEVRVV